MSEIQLRTLRSTLSREDFIERSFSKSKSWGSKNAVEGALKKFDMFCLDVYNKQSSELLQEIRMSTGDELYLFLQDFINYMDKKGLKPKSIKTYFGFIKSYLRSQGIKTNHDDLKDLVRFPENVKEILEPLTKEKIRILLDGSKPDRKALYLTLLSSGMRIGEALSLRKKDFDFTKDPVKITIPGKFTKTKQTRETYISSEAKDLLLRLVKDKTDDDLVFATSEDLQTAEFAEERAFDNLRKRCGLTERYSDGKRHKITIHSMRAFFHTLASSVNGEQYANALDGHQGYLLQYYRLTPSEREESYRKLEPSLLIFSDNLYDQRKEMENLKKEMEDLKKTNGDLVAYCDMMKFLVQKSP